MVSKRDRIIQAAITLYRTRGVGSTTLKDISGASTVPLGNLYYYFKTRTELTFAVLDACEQELQDLLGTLNGLDPLAWLDAYFSWLLKDPEVAARLGCPFGAFATQLRALGDPAAARAAEVVRAYLNAVCAPLLALGYRQVDAEEVFTGIQGVYTVAHALNDPQRYVQGIRQLRDRLRPDRRTPPPSDEAHLT